VISLEDARARILSSVEPLTPRVVRRDDARGLVLAESVVAGEAVPPFANTGMDGYAVRAADTAAAPVRLRVVDELAAGRAPTRVVSTGEAIRIMTGAPMPEGADAIVMVEVTHRDGDHVVVDEPARVGDHIRPAGGDLAAGAAVFAVGTVLTPAHIGVLASLGIDDVRCYPRPRVGVISTGDELVESGPLAPGRIRDSNRPMLLAVVAESGFDAVDCGIARDDKDEIAQRITAAVEECDALLTSGAVSMGDFDYVKIVLEELAATRPGSGFVWSQVAIKPAKPLAFGTLGAVPVFGLPGNPVSSRVSFELFARPALKRLAGRSDVEQPIVRATARTAFSRRPDGKLHLDRVRLAVEDGRYVCERAGFQASNVLSGMAAATGLALIPDGSGVDAGGEVEVLVLGA
jgi:molybdenum cofactor synthesis domain-containing protein